MMYDALTNMLETHQAGHYRLLWDILVHLEYIPLHLDVTTVQPGVIVATYAEVQWMTRTQQELWNLRTKAATGSCFRTVNGVEKRIMTEFDFDDKTFINLAMELQRVLRRKRRADPFCAYVRYCHALIHDDARSLNPMGDEFERQLRHLECLHLAGFCRYIAFIRWHMERRLAPTVERLKKYAPRAPGEFADFHLRAPFSDMAPRLGMRQADYDRWYEATEKPWHFPVPSRLLRYAGHWYEMNWIQDTMIDEQGTTTLLVNPGLDEDILQANDEFPDVKLAVKKFPFMPVHSQVIPGPAFKKLRPPRTRQGVVGYDLATAKEVCILDNAVPLWSISGKDYARTRRRDTMDFCAGRTSIPAINTRVWFDRMQEIVKYLMPRSMRDIFPLQSLTLDNMQVQTSFTYDSFFKSGTDGSENEERHPGFQILADLVHFGCIGRMAQVMCAMEQRNTPGNSWFLRDSARMSPKKSLRAVIRSFEYLRWVLILSLPPSQLAEYYGANPDGQFPEFYYVPALTDEEIECMTEFGRYVPSGSLIIPFHLDPQVTKDWHAQLLLNVHPYYAKAMRIWYQYPYSLAYVPVGYYHHAEYQVNTMLLPDLRGNTEWMWPTMLHRNSYGDYDFDG